MKMKSKFIGNPNKISNVLLILSSLGIGYN